MVERKQIMQTKKMSLIETVSSVIIGFIVAIISQLGIFPILEIEVTFSEHLIENIVLACPHCNMSKHDKDPIEFANKLGRLL